MSVPDRFVLHYWSTHYRRFMPTDAAGWARAVDRLEKNFGEFLDAIPRDGAILDAPCGVGYLEHCLRRRRFGSVRALDASAEQIDIARRELSNDADGFPGEICFEVADVFDHLRGDVRYAAIAMIDFLEHLPKPRILELLDLCHRALAPGGILLLRVSNAGNPAWGWLFYRDFTHETPFTHESLVQCLEVGRFDVLKAGYEVDPGRRAGAVARVKHAVRTAGRWSLAKVLGIPPESFSEDVIAVARRP